MQNLEILALAGLRVDGRRPGDLRTMQHKMDCVEGADGSAYIEQGLNKVLVMIHGPQEPRKKTVDHSAEKVGGASSGGGRVSLNLVTFPPSSLHLVW
jgi:ribonuclease PH